jgi:hypothetical protein
VIIVDIVEQVIPATTLWEVLKSNSVFDTQKFKYRSYTTLLGNPFYNSKISNLLTV